MESNYEILIRKLDFFIRKYYKNLLIKGLLLSSGMLVSFFIALNILEYFAWFNPLARTLLFILFISVIAGITGYFIINPALKLYKIGSIITHKHAAEIIGKHFDGQLPMVVLSVEFQVRESQVQRMAVSHQANKNKNPGHYIF